ncbi:NAD(P)H-binding protein [Microbacterium sp. zg.B48]|uniref:NAD(P)-dependent oxidoreductase n=1 Tax=Microbacterium sp. zg.B48 TaxID=2969408 RepID=UPI00214BB2F5|nr:NAD(P)H-binding protein [Microbacterium sp. zg.B48]MCR2762042.1 NAD(P)H-binding protein [Microbacterium sp. zg.B48]
MKIAVFGGAGRAGGALVQLATQRGHSVRALVRGRSDPGSPLAHVEVVSGDAFDADAVARTIAGADVVVSTLGGYRGPESISAGTANIVTAMRADGPDRLVVLQGFHIDFPGDPGNPAKTVVRAFLALRCRPLLAHGEALGELLRATDDLAWTLIRIPRIVNGSTSGRAVTGRFALGPIASVRVGDAASTLLELAETVAHLREAPMLFTPRWIDRKRVLLRAELPASDQSARRDDREGEVWSMSPQSLLEHDSDASANRTRKPLAHQGCRHP